MLRKLAVYLIALAALFIIAGCSSNDTTTTTDETTMDLETEIVGSWEATDEGVTETYTFNEDGTFEAKAEVVVDEDTKSESSATGTYSIDGDELTMVTDNIEGQAEENGQVDTENVVDDETLGIPNEPFVSTIKIENDTLTIDAGDNGTYEFTRVK